jgi:hypothetical protein
MPEIAELAARAKVRNVVRCKPADRDEVGSSTPRSSIASRSPASLHLREHPTRRRQHPVFDCRQREVGQHLGDAVLAEVPRSAAASPP